MVSGDLTDAEWELVGPLLPRERGRPGRPGHDNRTLLDGILWRRARVPAGGSIPERYGKWNSVWRRFARWRDLGVFEAVFAPWPRAGAAEERVQMLDGTTIRAHQHAAGAESAGMIRRWGRSRGGFSTKLHLRSTERPAARDRPHARQTHEMRAFDTLVEDLAPGTRCLIGDSGLRRRPGARSPAAAGRPAGHPGEPGPQGAGAPRPRPLPAEEPGRAAGEPAQAVPRRRHPLRQDGRELPSPSSSSPPRASGSGSSTRPSGQMQPFGTLASCLADGRCGHPPHRDAGDRVRRVCSVERFCAQGQAAQADRHLSGWGRRANPDPRRLLRFPPEPFDRARRV
jgi:transposase